jgi:hypothetical protein
MDKGEFMNIYQAREVENMKSEIEELQSQLADKDKAIAEAEDVINKLMFTIINYTDYPGYEIECSKDWLEKYGSK